MWSGDTGTALRLFDEGVQAGFAESHGASFVVPLIHRGERRTALLYLNLLGAGPEGAVVFARAIAAPDGPVALTERDQATVDRLLTSGDENFLGNISPPIARLWLRQYDKVVDDPLFDAAYVYQWQVGLRGWPDSPGFKAVVDRLGLPAYWRRHGYPPMCRPAGADGYSCRTADIRGAVARAR